MLHCEVDKHLRPLSQLLMMSARILRKEVRLFTFV